jgi:hypothetical protein
MAKKVDLPGHLLGKPRQCLIYEVMARKAPVYAILQPTHLSLRSPPRHLSRTSAKTQPTFWFDEPQQAPYRSRASRRSRRCDDEGDGQIKWQLLVCQMDNATIALPDFPFYRSKIRLKRSAALMPEFNSLWVNQ